MNDKALIAMSGGVDSSVAAYLIKQRGFECTGATIKMFGDDIGSAEKKSCGSPEEAKDAESVAARLGIAHYLFDFTDDFKKQVIARFAEAYQNGLTPNPCVDCNRYIKFEKFLLRAQELGIDHIVTGHYAKIEYDEKKRRYLLKKASDPGKDQSYVLYTMSQAQLEHTIFPLGELCKHEVRAIAAEQGFVNAAKKDSQDICFADGGDYAGFIEKYTGNIYESGDFIDIYGNVLGRHKGIIRYTVGQRRGLGLAAKNPLYVHSKNIADNTVTLGENDGLFTKSLEAGDFNWIACEKPETPLRIKAKVRYNQTEQWAKAEQISEDTVHIEFDEPQRAIAKGQAAVLYDGDIVVGGGTIL
jgi:tRNA-specific 2-thiouridylase